ncbi:MAG: hypothetical protein IPI06_14070 [Gammaproteobacteria bacterium]|nr:hypothetical protein [Gammaproteobacteria bacterium]
MSASTGYSITASDKTKAAIDSAKRNFRDLDRSVKSIAGNLANVGKLIGAGGAVFAAFKAFGALLRAVS